MSLKYEYGFSGAILFSLCYINFWMVYLYKGKIKQMIRGILFLVNKENKLTACITDGDIRRFLC